MGYLCLLGVPELIPVLGSQPAGDVSHKPGGQFLTLCHVNPTKWRSYRYRRFCDVTSSCDRSPNSSTSRKFAANAPAAAAEFLTFSAALRQHNLQKLLYLFCVVSHSRPVVVHFPALSRGN